MRQAASTDALGVRLLAGRNRCEHFTCEGVAIIVNITVERVVPLPVDKHLEFSWHVDSSLLVFLDGVSLDGHYIIC
jgi:hypothetical protein